MSTAPISAGISIREFLGKIQASGKEGDWLGRCPIHSDEKASLHVTLTSSNKILLHCFVCGSGNAFVAELKEIGLWPITLDGKTIGTATGPDPTTSKVDLSHLSKTDEKPPRVPVPPGFSSSKIHEYRSITGHLIGTVTRFEKQAAEGTKAEKTFRPTFYFMEEGGPVWRTKAPAIKPLYGQQTLTRSGIVIIVEGEKTQEAAAQVFTSNPVVSPMGGVQGFSRTDLSPLQGRKVIVWPDADQTWRKNAEEWSKQLAHICAEVSIVQIPQSIVDNHPKWDLADPLPDYPRVVRALLDSPTPFFLSGQRAIASIKKAEDLLEQFIMVKTGTTGFEFVWRQENRKFGTQQFDVMFNSITRPRFGSRPTSYFLENDRNGLRTFEGYEYLPEADWNLRHEDGRWLFNNWVPTRIKPKEGSIAPFLEHLSWLLSPEDGQELLYRFGNLIQNPRNRPTSIYLLQGKQGVGKNIIFNIFSDLVGPTNYYAADPSSILSGYNSFLINKTVVIINEFTDFNKSEFMEQLKSLITEKLISVREKYMSEYLISNYAHMFAMTNLDRPVNLPTDDRRFYVAKCLPEVPYPSTYYTDLVNWLDSHLPELLHYFQNMDLSTYSPKAIPAMTDAKAKIIDVSKKSPERRYHALLELGVDGPFRFNIYPLADFHRILEEQGIKNSGDLNKMLDAGGYKAVSGTYIYKYQGRNYKKSRNYAIIRTHSFSPESLKEISTNPHFFYEEERKGFEDDSLADPF